MKTPASTGKSYRIGVDTGGTFTDIVVGDSQSILAVGKALTTPERISRGILAALSEAADHLGKSARELLAETSLFSYGSTRATNAILEGKTARTALLVTEGFPDILVRREGGKTNPWDYSQPYPKPYIPRSLTFEVRERMSAEGEVLVPLDLQRATEAAGRIKEAGAEAVAICFLWSIANGRHELEMARILSEVLPGVPWTLSHELNPIIREYRRASSTAIDASLKPLMQEHLREMELELREEGLSGELLPATSLGGVLHLNDVIDRPIHMVRSGPALAPVLGRELARIEHGAGDVLVCDTGGTSFDVSLVRSGRLVFSRDTWLGGRYTGHITGFPSVDARSIGAGGGSIAQVDSGGLLRVGPESAGANPGPACYDRGGVLPTVTDAALVLGYLDPTYFLGGRMALNVEAAQMAVGRLAASLGRSLEVTAAGIITLAGEQMVEAIKEITINEGVDPRESLLVAGGGAAGINIALIARALECRSVLVPKMAGVLSACGAQYTDLVMESTANVTTTGSSFDFAAVQAALDSIDQKLRSFKSQMGSTGARSGVIEYSVEAHYLNQVWELEIPVRFARIRSADEVESLVREFHAAHEAVFAVSEPGQEVEFVQWKGRLTAELSKPSSPRAQTMARAQTAAAPRRQVNAYFPEGGWRKTATHVGAELRPGAEITGPAVIHERMTTIVVHPGSTARVTEHGNYMLSLQI